MRRMVDYEGTPEEGMWAEVQDILEDLEDPRGRWEDYTGDLDALIQRLRTTLATLAEET